MTDPAHAAVMGLSSATGSVLAILLHSYAAGRCILLSFALPFHQAQNHYGKLFLSFMHSGGNCDSHGTMT